MAYDVDEQLEQSTNRLMAIGFVLMLVMVLVFPFYRVFEPGTRKAERETQLTSLATSGESIWGFNCASCHGLRGDGSIGPALNSKQFLSSATDAQMELLVSVGVPGSQMSAFSQDHGGPLTSEQIKAVVTYVRSWEASAPDRPDWRTAFIGGTTSTTAKAGG